MDKETIDRIVELRDEAITKEIDGTTYSPLPLHPVLYEPRPAKLVVRSLTGLVDYLKTLFQRDRSSPGGEVVLHVESPAEVHVVASVDGKDLKRDVYASAILDPAFKAFPFGEFMSVEEFLIRLRYLFSPSPDMEKILAYASKITSGTTLELETDGVTQKAIVTRGASGATKELKDSPVIVALRPFRTFRELEQTESEFLFRLRLNREEAPECALFEADGGRWRNVTMLNIKEYLEGKALGISVIA